MRAVLSVVVALILLAGFAVEVVWAAPSAQGGTVHIVRRGETLYIIARRYGTTVQAIAQANGLANPNRIYIGQRLIIPSVSAPTLPRGSPSTLPRGSPSIQPRPTVVRPQAIVPQSPAQSYYQNYYIVRRGDSLSTIARRFGTTVSAIVQANNLYHYRYIYPGQRLIIPSGSIAAPVVPTPLPAPTPVPPPPWPVNWPDFR